MKNDEPKIWVTITEKVNIGNYESVEVQAGVSKVYGKDDPNELMQSTIDEVTKIVKKQAKTIRKNRKK